MVLYSLTAGHKGILTKDVWHDIWRLYTRLYCLSQNGTNTVCGTKSKTRQFDGLVKWKNLIQ